MNYIKKITKKFSIYDWFVKVESTSHKNEFMIFVDKYPYSKDNIFSEYEKENKIRIKIHALQ